MKSNAIKLPMPHSPEIAIQQWLDARLSAEANAWLRDILIDAPSFEHGRLERVIALAGRRAGNERLDLSASELEQADRARAGWNPLDWTVADAARARVLLAVASDVAAFGETFKRLCQTADLGTLIGLYRGLPVFPFSEALDWQIGEGLRTSIQAVFEAIAHKSPVPAELFSEHRWNHMVLKALFIGADLQPIAGLDERRNVALAATLVDHVHERRAAGREIDPQVWRCIAPFAQGGVLTDIAPMVQSARPLDRLAAALCLGESPDPGAATLLADLAPERERILSGAVTWDTLADPASEHELQVK